MGVSEKINYSLIDDRMQKMDFELQVTENCDIKMVYLISMKRIEQIIIKVETVLI